MVPVLSRNVASETVTDGKQTLKSKISGYKVSKNAGHRGNMQVG